MKFASPLTIHERITLEELHKNGIGHKARTRSLAILLSANRYSLDEISRILNFTRNRISAWINRWETIGVVGLFDNYRSGRPTILDTEERTQALEIIKANPRSLKKSQAEIKAGIGKEIGYDTIKRLAKALGLRWKRVRKSLKNKRDPAEFERVKNELLEYKEQADKGNIDLTYFDEAGFDLTPTVPYAWQEPKETITLPSSKSIRINVLGFMQESNDLEPYVIDGKVDTQVVIACFDDYANKITKDTVVYIDNASVHTSKAFKKRIEDWRKKGLIVKYLSKYSPELNKIEILWRFIKYQWLPFEAYTGLGVLRSALNHILANFGKEYCIEFS